MAFVMMVGDGSHKALKSACLPIADMQTISISSVMKPTRSMIAVFVLVVLGACGSSRVTLPPCWHAADLQQGERFIGTVYVYAAPDIRPMIFPVACDGGVTAYLPDGMRLPAYAEGGPPNADGEGLFYKARVAGQVEGIAFERPSVRLARVISPKLVAR